MYRSFVAHESEIALKGTYHAFFLNHECFIPLLHSHDDVRLFIQAHKQQSITFVAKFLPWVVGVVHLHILDRIRVV